MSISNIITNTSDTRAVVTVVVNEDPMVMIATLEGKQLCHQRVKILNVENLNDNKKSYKLVDTAGDVFYFMVNHAGVVIHPYLTF